MSQAGKSRVIHVFVLLAICFTLFSWRLIYLQVTQHKYYASLAAENHIIRKPIHAPRGAIYDRRGEVLAVSEPLKTVVADGTHIADPQRVAEAIADLLEMPVDKVVERLDPKRPYIVLKRKVEESVALEMRERLATLKLKGIYFEQDARRVYPNGKMLAHVIGFLNQDLDGVQGVERTMNDYLRGREGFRFTERDRAGHELVAYRGQERPARPGYNVRLTIDMSIQTIVEEELDAAFADYKPEVATVVMMQPQTGRVLAMASRPCFDANSPGQGKPAEMKNAAIINLVEPGSTFKIMTAAAALNDKLVTLDTVINCENGRFHFAGRILRDHGHGPFPNLSVADILVKSSNIGVAKLAMQMGERRFYEYIRRFGFGERTGITLPGEIQGILHPPHKWSKISISRIPMGQGVATTPIQMVTAVSAVANGGKLMMPQIVESVFDNGNRPIVNYDPIVVRDVVSEETTELVKTALSDVVSRRGTARQAAVKGFSVAGKTGTAQKANPRGGYYDDRYVTSFIGFMPVKDPAFVMLVLFDDAKVPNSRNYGGTLAGPVFARIAERTARYLNLAPDLPEIEGIPPLQLTATQP